MAFVSRSDRKYILENPDISKLGPGEYISQEFPKIIQEAKLPFSSNTFRNHKIIKEDIPGPGSYFHSKKKDLPREKDKSFEHEKSLQNSFDAASNISNDISLLKDLRGKPGFGSGIRRFYNQISNITVNPGPGMYYKDDSFINYLDKQNLQASNNISLIKQNSSKHSLSTTRLSTIPSKIHSYGYNINNSGNFSLNKDPLRNFKYLGTKIDSVGPGSYDLIKPSTKIKNTLDWSKSLKGDTESLHQPGYSMVLKEDFEDSKIEINNKLQKDGKVFKANKNDVYKYFFRKRTNVRNSDIDLVEEGLYQQSPGPGYYNQGSPKIFYKNQKFQFFGSSTERLKDVSPSKNNPLVGPSSYFYENEFTRVSEFGKSQKPIGKKKENNTEKMQKKKSPGPGDYDIPRDFGKNSVSIVTDFGSREKRFSSLEKEKISTGDIPNEASSYSKSRLREIEKNFLNKLENKLVNQKSPLNVKKSVFDVKKSQVPPVGTYDPQVLHSISNKIMKKVGQSDNSNSPFASSINTRLTHNKNTTETKIGPGYYYYHETKPNKIQTKVPFNIGDKKYSLHKISDNPSPGEYETMNNYNWNKKSYNNLFN